MRGAAPLCWSPVSPHDWHRSRGETGHQEIRHQAAYTAGIVAPIDRTAQEAIGCFRHSHELARGIDALEGEALQGLTLAAAAADDEHTASIFAEALDTLGSMRLWSHTWMVLEALAIHWADTGQLSDAATLLGGLTEHGRASVFLVAGRSRAQASIAADPTLRVAVLRGGRCGAASSWSSRSHGSPRRAVILSSTAFMWCRTWTRRSRAWPRSGVASASTPG